MKGATDCYLVSDILALKKVSVILGRTHELPNYADEDVHQSYKTQSVLDKAGVSFALSNEVFWQVRNLPFQAEQTIPFGLSIEIGKDASFIISEGDILDMKTSRITQAFIDSRSIDLGNKQTDLYHKFMKKYGLEVRE